MTGSLISFEFQPQGVGNFDRVLHSEVEVPLSKRFLLIAISVLVLLQCSLLVTLRKIYINITTKNLVAVYWTNKKGDSMKYPPSSCHPTAETVIDMFAKEFPTEVQAIRQGIEQSQDTENLLSELDDTFFDEF